MYVPLPLEPLEDKNLPFRISEQWAETKQLFTRKAENPNFLFQRVVAFVFIQSACAERRSACLLKQDLTEAVVFGSAFLAASSRTQIFRGNLSLPESGRTRIVCRFDLGYPNGRIQKKN